MAWFSIQSPQSLSFGKVRNKMATITRYRLTPVTDMTPVKCTWLVYEAFVMLYQDLD